MGHIHTSDSHLEGNCLAANCFILLFAQQANVFEEKIPRKSDCIKYKML